jgi:LPS sulfotransferase NodH
MSPPAAGDDVCYAICALPRSGSWLLTLGLEDSGLAGRPRPDLCGLSGTAPAPGQTRLSRVQAAAGEIRGRHASPNGVFGLKLESADLPELIRYVAADGSFQGTEDDFLSRLFPGLRYIYLVRQDKTRQALSLLRGLRTHRWMTISTVPEDGDWEPAMERLHAVRTVLIEQEKQWEAFFAQAGTEPYRVSYEDFSRDDHSYRTVIAGVLRHLGVSATVVLPPPRLNRQADQHTERLARAYQAWLAAGGHRDGEERALTQVAGLSRQAHMMLGDGRLTLDEALALAARASPGQPAGRLGRQVMQALSDDETESSPGHEDGGGR